MAVDRPVQRDSTADGPRDSRSDIADSPSDASRFRAKFPGELLPELDWIPIDEGLPEYCVVDRAQVPEEAFELQWRECPGVDGCRYMYIPEPPAQVFPRPFAGTFDGDQAYLHFWIRRTDGTILPSQLVQILIGADSGATMAIRHLSLDPDKLCTFAAMATHPQSAAFTIAAGLPFRDFVFHAPLDEIGEVTRYDAMISGRVIQLGVVSPSTYVGATTGGEIVIVEGDTHRIVELTEDVFGAPVNPHVVGRFAVWEDWPGSNGTRLVGATIDSEPQVLWSPEGWDVKRSFVRPDGVVVWTQMTPSTDDDRMELWTGRIDGTELLEPRKLRDITDFVMPIDGPDVYGDGKVRRPTPVYDVDTEPSGLRYVIEPREGVYLSTLVASSPTELFFRGSVEDDGRTHDTFVRLDRSAFLRNGSPE